MQSVAMNNSRIENFRIFKHTNLDGSTHLHFVESDFVGTFNSIYDRKNSGITVGGPDFVNPSGGQTPWDANKDNQFYKLAYHNNFVGDGNYKPHVGSAHYKNIRMRRFKKGVHWLAGNALRVENVDADDHRFILQSAVLETGFNQLKGYNNTDVTMLERCYINGRSTQTNEGVDINNNTDIGDKSVGDYYHVSRDVFGRNMGDGCFDFKTSTIGQNCSLFSTSRSLRMHNHATANNPARVPRTGEYLRQIYANTIIDPIDIHEAYRHLLWMNYATNDPSPHGVAGKFIFYNCLFRSRDGTLSSTFPQDSASWGAEDLIGTNTNTFGGGTFTDATVDFADVVKFIGSYSDYLNEVDALAVGTENGLLGSSPSGYDPIKDLRNDILYLEYEGRDGNSGSWQRIVPESGLSVGSEYVGAMMTDISDIDNANMQYRVRVTRRSTGAVETIDTLSASPWAT